MPGDPVRGLRVAVLGQSGGWHVERLLAALSARGHRGCVVGWSELAAEIDQRGPHGAAAPERFRPAALSTADAVLVRSMPGGGLEEVIFRMDLLAGVSAGGTPVINPPRSLEIAIDKYLALSRLAAAGLPVPRTVVVQNPASIMAAWESLSGDCIAKPMFGSQGRGIVRLDDRRALEPLLAAAAAAGPEGAVTYLQEFVPHDGWDVRILVVGSRTFAIRRFAPPDDWRTNLSLGGRPEAIAAPAGWTDLAIAATKAVGAEIAGVDLMPASDGRILVLEINAVPGWRGLQTVTSADIAEIIVLHLESSARRRGNSPA